MESPKLCHKSTIEIDNEPFLIRHQFTQGKWVTSCERRIFNPYPFGNSLHINYGVRIRALAPFQKRLLSTLGKLYRKLTYVL